MDRPSRGLPLRQGRRDLLVMSGAPPPACTDSFADRVLDPFEQIAAETDKPNETESLQARDIGTAIVEEAVEAKADLILLGMPYRRKFGEFDLGRTIPYVLKNAPCEVWLCREPI